MIIGKQNYREQNYRDYVTTSTILNQCAAAKVAKLSSWLLLIYK